MELEDWKQENKSICKRKESKPILYEGEEHQVLYNIMSRSGTVGKYGWHPYKSALEILNDSSWTNEYKEFDHVTAMHTKFMPADYISCFTLPDYVFARFCKPEIMYKVYADRDSMNGGCYIDPELKNIESHIQEDLKCGGVPAIEPVMISQWELILMPEFEGY